MENSIKIYFFKSPVTVLSQSAEERRRSRGASALQRFAEKEKRAEEVRAKKASLPVTSHEGEEEN